MAPDFSWIYLVFFLIIPLSRIIPRLIAKRRAGDNFQNRQDKQSQQMTEYSERPQRVFSRPQTKNMLVLGELNRGTKTFEGIQKNTGLDSKELDMILEELEKKGMLLVQQKQGMFGPKVELYATDKGFKEYYS